MAPSRAEPLRIAFLGFGLIGGSLAMALRAAARDERAPARERPPTLQLSAWTPSGRGPALGRERGILDEAAGSPGEAIAGAGLVILAAPPLAVLGLLDGLAGAWRAALSPGAVVTDVASTKAEIVTRAGELALPFVGGHPMAGREVSGVEAASAALFVGRPWVVVEPAGAVDGSALATVESLARWVGATPVRMTAGAHDVAVAAISHLPLVVAAALAEAVTGGADWPAFRALAASGWRDTTRLAHGDPEMGAGILATNADAVAEGLVGLRGTIDAWIAALRPAAGGAPDADALRARLAAVRGTLEPAAEGDR